ncbi:Uncharacterised protein [Mycolicibacterium vanbaalenii]|uniref:Uncharacterized protein n=1 Tax=Mycolicibacterium vanbaalenii TaxID=110539 RepID=A0A5S9Q9R0_MYCVN|nr:hypothetical protein [Mycolicibacterium vanbaalenii]CAA0114789.1 Uncharacterised protein [Mycolicibacterium vanbaalenii]
MNEPITGSVALVEDEYTLVINRGAGAGVAPGMVFAVFSGTGQVVTDPESGRVLGRLSEETVRVKVFDVHELFSRAETFSIDVPRSPGRPKGDFLDAGKNQLLGVAATPIANGVAELARLAGDALPQDLSVAASGDVVTVNVGDAVELVL